MLPRPDPAAFGLLPGFLRYCESVPESRGPLGGQEATETPEWVLAHPFPLQPWPALVEEEAAAEIRRVTVGLSRLVRSVPRRIFGDDMAKIARFYALESPLAAAAILEEPNGIDDAIARGDFVRSASGWQCIEFNMSSCLGGWRTGNVAGIVRSPWLQRFLDQRGLACEFVDPVEALFAHLVDVTLRRPGVEGDRVNVAFLLERSDWESWRSVDRSLVDDLARRYRRFLESNHPGLEGECIFAPRDGVERRRGSIVVQDLVVHAVVEYHEPAADRQLFVGQKSGAIGLFNGPVATLLRDKRNLALLSEHQDSDLLDADDRALIRDHVPWTRVTRPGEVSFEGCREPLERIARERRERLVAKSAQGSGGESVFIGARTSPAQWEEILERAFRTGRWVLQEAVESLPYRFWSDTSGAVPHDVVWGFFAYGERYGGGFLRMTPKEDLPGVINSARGATEGVILEVRSRSAGLSASGPG